MLIFYSDELTITGVQLVPQTSTRPHIKAADALFERLEPVIGRAALQRNAAGDLVLPDNLHQLSLDALRVQQQHQQRAVRNGKLHQLDQLISNPLRWSEFSAAEQAELADYRLALLNVPQQPQFPDSIVWPAVPAALQALAVVTTTDTPPPNL